MIAKIKSLIYSYLKNSSLQLSLQSCKLSYLNFLQIQMVSQIVCKEKQANNQRIDANFFAALFAKTSNSKNENK